jgi:hypothetical protein
MRVKALVSILCVVGLVSVASGAQVFDLTPLTSVPDENSFGTLYMSQSVPFSKTIGPAPVFSGTLHSRVYTQGSPVTAATFVYDIEMTAGFSSVDTVSIASNVTQNDLRITEIAAGVNGYVSDTTTNVPNEAKAFDNDFPVVDELLYTWYVGNTLASGDRATLYVTTTGAVDIEVIDVSIQNGGSASATVLAPVDDPGNPDIGIPEPASMMLVGMAGCFVLRRRR